MKNSYKFFGILFLFLVFGCSGVFAQYCNPTYSTGCTYGDGLTLFQLGTINQPITCSAWYHDYTALSTGLTIGTAATITVQAGYAGTYVNFYIDYNHNNTFDAGELIGQLNCSATTTNFLLNFTPPVTALTGNTRLRALTEWYSYPTGPCTAQTYGNCEDFTVNISGSATPPTITTTAATTITTTTATLNGTVNANGASTAVTVQYGLTVAYGTTVAGVPSPVTGSTATGVSAAITGLTPNTLFHFRVVGVNSAGTTYGNDMTFTTLASAPSVLTQAATAITAATATLNGTVNANNNSTTVSFDYGLTVAYGTNVAGVPATATGSAGTTVTAALTGLVPNTLYHFRVNGVNVAGTSNGGDLTFTTAQVAPTVTTTAATLVTNSSATMNGTINANNLSTTASFDYGLTVAYGTSVAATPATVTGSANTNVSANLTGLTINTTYHYRVKGVSSAGTSLGSDQTFFTVCNLAAAAGIVTGPVQVCQGGTGYVYTVPSITNAVNYNWTLPAGATITAGANTNSITVSYAVSAVSGNISVYGSNACGNGTVSPNLAVTVNAQPAPTVSGPAAVCALSTGNVYTTQAGMTGYTWTVSAGGAITAGTGTNSITVTWNTSGAQTVSVNYANASGCTAVTPPVYAVTVNVLPVPTIAGPAAVCMNSTGNVYTTQAGMTGYTWTVSAGGTITAGGTTSSITVTWSTAGAKTVTVNYANASNCMAAVPTTYAVTVNALPVPTVAGTASLCQYSTGVVYTTETGMTNYTWTVSTGGVVTAGGTATSNTVTVNWNTAGAQSVTINYINSNGCTAASATSYPVTVKAAPVPTIGSNNAPCVGSTGNMYYTEAGMTGYAWTLSPGGTIASGQGTSAINVTWTGVGAQWVNVNYTNGNMCTAPAPSVYNLFVNPLPNAAGTVTGTAALCAGTSGVAYSCAEILNATTYTWTMPAGATIATGAGTKSITVNFGTTAVSGNIIVAGTNSCGNGTASPAFTVTVNPLPAAAGTITGAASVCVNATAVAYSVPTIANANGYVWTIPAGATITSGGTTKNIVVNYGPTSGTGVVSVKGTNTCGSGTVSNLNVTMNAIPPAPVVTASGNMLTSSAATGNQWYYEGALIAGATYQTYAVTHNSGYYWSVVTVNGCSSPISNKVWVVILGQQDLQGTSFNVYPVPSEGRFTLSVTSPVQETYLVAIYNQMGSKICDLGEVQVNGTFERQIDLRPVTAGIYSAVFLNSARKVVKKILVIR